MGLGNRLLWGIFFFFFFFFYLCSVCLFVLFSTFMMKKETVYSRACTFSTLRLNCV